MPAMDLLHPTRGLPILLAPPFPGMLQKALQQPTKCSCNHLHFCFATTYISGLQLSTFLFYNKQRRSKSDKEKASSLVLIQDEMNQLVSVLQSEQEDIKVIIQNISETTFGFPINIPAVYDQELVQSIKKQGGIIVFPFIPYTATTVDFENPLPFPSSPSIKHLLGTDDQGRDIAARLLYGIRISLCFGFILTFCSSIIGIFIGALQGYFAGKTDLIFSRFLEIWSSLPQLFILMILSSFITPSFISLLLILLLFQWTALIPVVRAEFLKTRECDYVLAAKALGLNDMYIIFHHILPNACVAAITYIPLLFAGSIISLSALDFLGLGLPIGTPSLGDLIRQGKENLQAPWIGLTAIITLTSILTLLLIIGDQLRTFLAPRGKE